ncbi:MAG TPA: hypothetical protein DCE42_12775 [Myxococcales bacterium]|nr:hypothetical protein [Deltaproteobacteria bacterium]MBU47204.1 hypothetical protein [Deltaproteobacteria bacterium]HAA55628.1 hypothetical protein [Myxococcales bacterium]
MSSEGPSAIQLLWQSLLGISLGIGGGLLFFWFISPPPPTPPPASRAKRTNTQRQAPQPLGPRSSPEEIYKRLLEEEVMTMQPGAGLRWLASNQPNFPLHPHLLSTLAEKLFALGPKYAKASSTYFHALLNMRQTLWSKKRLYYRIAYAHWNMGQKKTAMRFLQRSVQLPLPRTINRGYHTQLERRELAAAYEFYAKFCRGQEKANVLFTLWTTFPENKYAQSAEKRWWRIAKKRRFRQTSSQALLRATEAYLSFGWSKKKANTLLKASKRRLSRRQKKQWMSLYARWQEQWGRSRAAYKALKKWSGYVSREKRPAQKYRMAALALKKGSRRKSERFFKKIRRNKRYWRALGYRDIARWYLRFRKFRKVKKYYQKAWRYTRRQKTLRELQASLFLELGRTHLIKRDRRRALRYINSSIRVLGRKPPSYLYWLARAQAKRGKKQQALNHYQELQKQAGLSYYGLLAGQRLRELGIVKPLVFHKEPRTQRWRPSKAPASKQQTLSILRQYGPKKLYLFALEALAVEHPSLPLFREIVKTGQSLGAYSLSKTWLHKPIQTFLKNKLLPSQALLLQAFPNPPELWRIVQRQARTFRLDPRLIAALIYHQSGFQENYQKGNFRGWLAPHPMLRLPFRADTARQIAISCQRLSQLRRRYNSLPIALQAFLHPDTRGLRTMSRKHKRTPQDLVLSMLSKKVRTVMHTYWIYKLLYITP